jgi:hypothetical protein
MDSHFVEAVCLAAVEILGEKDAFIVLKKNGVHSFTSFDSSKFSLQNFGAELAHRFDMQIVMGLMIRIGRASLTFLRRFFPEISDLGKIDNRLKPIHKRFSESLLVLAKVVADELGSEVSLKNIDKASYEWIIQTDDQAYTPYYHFGLLEEFCYWLDARKDYRIVHSPKDSTSSGEAIVITVMEKE